VQLPLAQFISGFAVNALVGRRACFQTSQSHFHAARIAISVIFNFDTFEGLVDFLDQFS
jgi:hypothetical protein